MIVKIKLDTLKNKTEFHRKITSKGEENIIKTTSSDTPDKDFYRLVYGLIQPALMLLGWLPVDPDAYNTDYKQSMCGLKAAVEPLSFEFLSVSLASVNFYLKIKNKEGILETVEITSLVLNDGIKDLILECERFLGGKRATTQKGLALEIDEKIDPEYSAKDCENHFFVDEETGEVKAK